MPGRRSSVIPGVINRTIFLIVACCLVTAAGAQGTFDATRRGTNGGVTGPVAVTPFGVGPRVHLDAGNRACVKIRAAAEPEKANPRIFRQVLQADNHCGQAIKIRACYARSERCIEARIFGYQKTDITLGIVFDGKIFDYQYRELFP